VPNISDAILHVLLVMIFGAVLAVDLPVLGGYPIPLPGAAWPMIGRNASWILAVRPEYTLAGFRPECRLLAGPRPQDICWSGRVHRDHIRRGHSQGHLGSTGVVFKSSHLPDETSRHSRVARTWSGAFPWRSFRGSRWPSLSKRGRFTIILKRRWLCS
jgi:hypothetical protein